MFLSGSLLETIARSCLSNVVSTSARVSWNADLGIAQGGFLRARVRGGEEPFAIISVYKA